jgi:formylglycine-generating enzyme
MRSRILIVLVCLIAPFTFAGGAAASPVPPPRSMVRMPAGSYLPFHAADHHRALVKSFRLDAYPVTRADFSAFLRSHPNWRRSSVARRSPGYLRDWTSDLDAGMSQALSAPVTNVTRPAAQAYCGAQGGRLPSVQEWEYVANASRAERDASHDARFKQELLELYTRPRPARLPAVGSTFMNAFGVWDMHGLVWEWVMTASDQSMHVDHIHNDDGSCAASAIGATDPTNSAAFLREEYRKLLVPESTMPNLGFRCAA